MRFFLRILLLLLLPVVSFADERKYPLWMGPMIELIQTREETTGREVLEQILKAIEDDQDSSFALGVQITDYEYFDRKIGLWVRNIPALTALQYVAEICHCEFFFKDGIWIIRNRVEGEVAYDDWVRFTSMQLEKSELSVYGLQSDEKGEVTVIGGEPWPKEGRIRLVDDRLVISATRGEIECFKSLQTLHKKGYGIPFINARQSKKKE